MVLRKKVKNQEKKRTPSNKVPSVLRRVVLAALPSVALVGSPLILDGCICPSKDVVRSFLLPPGDAPKSHEDCIALCRRELRRVSRVDKHVYGSAVDLKDCATADMTEAVGEIVQGRTALRCSYKVTRRCIGGRLPAGVLNAEEQEDVFADVGAYFAQLCYLERAAVEAFRQLAQELSLHGAPVPLIEWAKQAIREEEEHAETTGVLAQWWGGEVRPVLLEEKAPRSLLELAYDNAVEGCVRETFAPLTAHWQALHAPHEAIRAVMQRIAEDEAGHASLSWAIEDWLSPMLGASARDEMFARRMQAIEALEEELQQEPSQALLEIAGLPHAMESLELLAQAKRMVWSV